jgi:hypothetical protein
VVDDVLRWQSLLETAVTLTRGVAGTTATWSGWVSVPADGGELGLLVVEEERLFAEDVVTGREAVTSRVVCAVAVPV